MVCLEGWMSTENTLFRDQTPFALLIKTKTGFSISGEGKTLLREFDNNSITLALHQHNRNLIRAPKVKVQIQWKTMSCKQGHVHKSVKWVCKSSTQFKWFRQFAILPLFSFSMCSEHEHLRLLLWRFQICEPKLRFSRLTTQNPKFALYTFILHLPNPQWSCSFSWSRIMGLFYSRYA